MRKLVFIFLFAFPLAAQIVSGSVSSGLSTAALQSGQPYVLTTSSSSGTTYTATGSPTLTALTKDQILTWDVGGTGCTAGAITLNVDTLGAKSVFEADGSTNPVAADCTANRIVRLAYNGTAFNIVGGGALPGGGTQTIANGTQALGTSSISSAACASVITISATGVATTDNILIDFNGDPTATTGYIPATAGGLTIFKYPTANNVNIKVCNFTSGAITPGAVTVNWRVVR